MYFGVREMLLVGFGRWQDYYLASK
jgi:hypothetical protein